MKSVEKRWESWKEGGQKESPWSLWQSGESESQIKREIDWIQLYETFASVLFYRQNQIF